MEVLMKKCLKLFLIMAAIGIAATSQIRAENKDSANSEPATAREYFQKGNEYAQKGMVEKARNSFRS